MGPILVSQVARVVIPVEIDGVITGAAADKSGTPVTRHPQRVVPILTVEMIAFQHRR